MALVKAKMRSNGTCTKGSRHVSRRSGCWRASMSGAKGAKKAQMSGKGKKK